MTKYRSCNNKLWADQTGQMSFFTLFFMIFLMMISGIALDSGQLFMTFARLSRAVDLTCKAAINLSDEDAEDREAAALALAEFNLEQNKLNSEDATIEISFETDPNDRITQVNVMGTLTKETYLVSKIPGIEHLFPKAFAQCGRPDCPIRPDLVGQTFMVPAPGGSKYQATLNCQRICNGGELTLPGSTECCPFNIWWVDVDSQTAQCTCSQVEEMEQLVSCDPLAGTPGPVNPDDPGVSGPVWFYRTQLDTFNAACLAYCNNQGMYGGAMVQPSCGSCDQTCGECTCYPIAAVCNMDGICDSAAGETLEGCGLDCGTLTGEPVMQTIGPACVCNNGILEEGEQCDPTAPADGNGMEECGPDCVCTDECIIECPDAEECAILDENISCLPNPDGSSTIIWTRSWGAPGGGPSTGCCPPEGTGSQYGMCPPGAANWIVTWRHCSQFVETRMIACCGNAQDRCGDGQCGASESACACPQDCPPQCGDGCCGSSETCDMCPGDCGNCADDAFCGNGVCDTPDEDRCRCDQDCGGFCDDNDTCTSDSCVAGTTACNYTPVSCNDNNACTTDRCENGMGCQYDPISCDDGDDCTIDTCNTSSGCTHSQSTAPGCDTGGGPCNNDEECGPGNCCYGGICDTCSSTDTDPGSYCGDLICDIGTEGCACSDCDADPSCTSDDTTDTGTTGTTGTTDTGFSCVDAADCGGDPNCCIDNYCSSDCPTDTTGTTTDTTAGTTTGTTTDTTTGSTTTTDTTGTTTGPADWCGSDSDCESVYGPGWCCDANVCTTDCSSGTTGTTDTTGGGECSNDSDCVDMYGSGSCCLGYFCVACTTDGTTDTGGMTWA